MRRVTAAEKPADWFDGREASAAADWFAVMVSGYNFRIDVATLGGRDPLQAINDPIARVGYETFVPRMVEEVRQSARRGRRGKRGLIVPALPGYVFVRMDLVGGDWRGLASVPAVRGVVAVDGVPARLQKVDLDRFVDRAQADAFRRTSIRGRLGIGDRVRMVCGPFEGLEAEIRDVVGINARALMSLFGGRRLSTVALDNLEKIS